MATPTPTPKRWFSNQKGTAHKPYFQGHWLGCRMGNLHWWWRSVHAILSNLLARDSYHYSYIPITVLTHGITLCMTKQSGISLMYDKITFAGPVSSVHQPADSVHIYWKYNISTLQPPERTSWSFLGEKDWYCSVFNTHWLQHRQTLSSYTEMLV